MNDDFTIIFTVDMGLKLFGLGIKDFIYDKMNIFDSLVNILSLLDLFLFSSKSMKINNRFKRIKSSKNN